jgi:hypothetical protein
MQRAQEFLKRYDISLSFADPQQYRFLEASSLDQQTLESKKAKQGILDLITEIGDVPVEMIKEMGVKKIDMTKIGIEKTGGYANVHAGDTFVFDPTKRLGTGFLHEGYHLYDVNHADEYSMYDDPIFKSLNPSDENIYSESGQTPDNYISDSENLSFELNTQNDLFTAKQQNDEQEVSRIQKELDKKAGQVVVPTNYAFTNVGEDKAEIARHIMGGLLDRVLARKSPILRRKAVFLLARLYHDNPAFVQFLVDTRIA